MDFHVLERYLLGGVFKGEFNCWVEVVHEILDGLELFGSAQEDQEDVVYESLPEEWFLCSNS